MGIYDLYDLFCVALHVSISLYVYLLSPFSPRLVSIVEKEVKKILLPCEVAGGI